jgi:hypothetical protein
MYESSQVFCTFIKKGKCVSYDKNIQLYTYELSLDDDMLQNIKIYNKVLLEINNSCKLITINEEVQLEFINDSTAWTNEFKNYFFKDISTFMWRCIKQKEIPDKFCIVEQKLCDTNSDDLILNKVIHITKWTKLLSDMADHVQDNNMFVFFVHHKEGKAKPYELNPFIDFSQVEKLDLDCNEKRYDQLYGSWHLDDAQTKDRQSVMLVSFAEIMMTLKDRDNPFEIFLSNTKKFHDRYSENYEIYVNRFSVDNQLREIDEQYLTFVGKLQDLVTSSQTKAFALPGVMVAIGALAKADNLLGIFAIVVGIIMTKIIINKSNELLHDNLNHFKATYERALNQYVKSRSEAEEVKDQANSAKQDLDRQFKKAQSRIIFIDSMSKWMLITGLGIAFIMLILIFIKTSPDEAKNIAEYSINSATNLFQHLKAYIINV